MLKLEYDEISPFSQEMTVIVEPSDDKEGVFNKLCMETGYYTSTDWTEGSDALIEYMENITQHNIDNSFFEEATGLFWFPYLLTTECGVIFADVGDSGFQWFVIPTTAKHLDGDKVELSLTYEKTTMYEKDCFPDALNEFTKLHL